MKKLVRFLFPRSNRRKGTPLPWLAHHIAAFNNPTTYPLIRARS